MKKNILKIRYLIKKNLIKFAEKFTIQQKGSKELKEFGIAQLQKLVLDLKKQLKIDETNYRYIANIGHSDARSFYLYSVISEVMKISIVNMRTVEFILDSEEDDTYKIIKRRQNKNLTDDEDEWLRRAIFEGFIDEQNLWRRRLFECLCDLICFTTCNEQPYYKLFIAANELSHLLYVNNDCLEFFDCKMDNIKEQALYALDIIKNTIKQTDKDKRWFLKDNILFDKLPESADFIKSYRQRYIKALKLANKGEKFILGFTYEVGYGGASRSMHFEMKNAPYRNLDYEYLKIGATYMSLLGYHILGKVYEILKTKPPKIGETIFKEIAEGSNVTELLFLSTIKDHDIGDLVSVGGNDLSEILDSKMSKYGYKSYRVKYLVNPLLSSVQEEWLPARYVQRGIIKKSKARDYFNGILKRNPDRKNEIEAILKMPDELLFKALKKVYIDLARHGILQKELKKSERRKTAS